MGSYRERRYTAQDGLSLYYRDYGDPLSTCVPILCLAGLTRNSKDFHDLAMRLCGNRRVVCPDYRGRGRSDYDPDTSHYQPSTYLDDIRHLLAVTGMHRVIVVGTSLGGLLAMAMGAAMPTVLAGVILNDIGPEVGRGGLDRILAYISQDRPQQNWDDAVAELKSMFPELGLASEEVWRKAAEATFRRGEDGRLHFDWDVRLVEPLRKKPPPDDLWPLYRSLRRVPVLVLRGERSDILSAETVARMVAEHPQATAVTIPRAGHVPTLAEPEATAAIDAFLEGM